MNILLPASSIWRQSEYGTHSTYKMFLKCREFARVVTITPIQHLATAVTRRAIVFWVSISLSLIGVSLYLCSGYIQQLNRGDILTTVSVSVLPKFIIANYIYVVFKMKVDPVKPFPAVTICHLNPYKWTIAETIPDIKNLVYNKLIPPKSVKVTKKICFSTNHWNVRATKRLTP